MYLNGMGIRGISRVTKISHVTILNWIQAAGESLSDEPQDEEIPEITEIDELQTFVGSKRNKYWIWTLARMRPVPSLREGQMREHRVNHQKKGIILWNIGDRSHQTFDFLWSIIKCWQSFWYVTDGWKVYPMYIEPEDHLISKTYMTRVEGENTRLRHYLARLHRKTLCYSKSLVFLRYSIRLLLHYLRFDTIPSFT